MKLTRMAAVLGVATAAVVVGALSGTLVATAISAPPPISQADLSVRPVEQFPTNEVGQTYGFVDQGLLTDASARAQLVAVATDEGRDGWAYWAELQPVAVALAEGDEEKAAALSTDDPYQVAVYELDGRTFIGFHTVNRPAEE